MKGLRPRLTYANVMATIAVFIALGGASYAAIKLPKNSVGAKQLKKNSVTSAKVTNNSLQAVDFRKDQLPKGEQGPKGDKGPRGEPGPLAETLPSGKTERGFYGFASNRAEGSNIYEPATSISYPIPLTFSPAIHEVPEFGSPTAECPGNEEEPTAAPGNLCIYEGRADGGLEAEKDTTNGRLGVLLLFDVPEGHGYEFYGSWAVTAP